MAKSSTSAKAALTVLVVVGFTVAYYLAGYWIQLEFLAAERLVFWIGVVVSVVLFIWKVLPRWLIALGWAILATYRVFLVPQETPSLFAVYFVIALFALFLILLATWANDVRRARRAAKRLGEKTFADMKRLEGLDAATVQALGDVANLSRQIQTEKQKGFPMDMDRILESIDDLERTMVVRGVTRSSRGSLVTAVEVLVGGPVALAIAAFVSRSLGVPNPFAP